MINLLNLCASFKYPSEDEIEAKAVYFGPQTMNKVLVLDMDETLIHSKFLTAPEQEKSDNGDFIVSLSNKNDD